MLIIKANKMHVLKVGENMRNLYDYDNGVVKIFKNGKWYWI